MRVMTILITAVGLTAPPGGRWCLGNQCPDTGG